MSPRAQLDGDRMPADMSLTDASLTDPSAPDAAPTARAGLGTPITRRRFLAGMAGALTVGVTLPVAASAKGRLDGVVPKFHRVTTAAATTAPAATGQNAITGWVSIDGTGTATIRFAGCEMGQGSLTGLSQAVAEELKVDWKKVDWAPTPAKDAYFTAGSSAIRQMLKPMRQAGAAAREMLISAAAQTWGIPRERCQATGGTVVDTQTGKTLAYGDLAALASTFPVPSDPPLTQQKDFTIIGRPVRRLDIPSKVDGSARYALDVIRPNMVFAVIKQCPTIGGKLKTPGPVPPTATRLVALDDAVAVIAKNTWLALQGYAEVQATWTTPTGVASDTTATISSTGLSLLTTGNAIVAEQQGVPAAAIDAAPTILEAIYEHPFLAHATMEVLNCTVEVTATSCEIWVPAQAPTWVINTAKAVTGLAESQITVHQMLAGGGLGRKFEQDYVAQAIKVAMAVGKPVKLMWPREEDFTHDQYRPASVAKIRAGLNADGSIAGWTHRIVQPSLLGQRGWLGAGQADSQAVEGAVALPYALGPHRIDWVAHTTKVPVGFWRSVGHSINTYTVECFIDELAAAAGMSPLAFRRKLLQGQDRYLAVLNAAADLAGMGTPPPAGRERGIALAESFGSIVAMVAECSQIGPSAVKVHTVSAAVDVGMAINPEQVRAQVEGGVIHGLSAALWGKVDFTNRKASVKNFGSYRVLKMREAPTVSVTIIESGIANLGGVGEVGVPPIAPAVANAWFRITGQRIRKLPMFPDQGTMRGG